jgi:hypothetical protein
MLRRTLHETHVCRDCGAEITLPYAAAPVPDAGLDVERLTAAINRAHHTVGRRSFSEHWSVADADLVAAEYDALSRQAEKETA